MEIAIASDDVNKARLGGHFCFRRIGCVCLSATEFLFPRVHLYNVTPTSAISCVCNSLYFRQPGALATVDTEVQGIRTDGGNDP